MAEPLPKRAPTLLDSLESRSSENLDIGLFVAQAVQGSVSAADKYHARALLACCNFGNLFSIIYSWSCWSWIIVIYMSIASKYLYNFIVHCTCFTCLWNFPTLHIKR